MSSQQSITEILPRIEQSIERLKQMVASMPPERTQEPLLAGGRSVKDVLGHLTWWDQWLLVNLPPAPGEPALNITLPLSDQIPTTNEWADEINAKVHLYNQSREFAVLWEELNATCELLLRRVTQLSDNDLYDPEGMASIIGYPVAPLITGIYEHYEEHVHELERLSGSHLSD